jgi:hypothetical protein
MKAPFIAGAAVLAFAAVQQELPVYTDITKEAGVTFKHSYGDHHLDNIVEGTGTSFTRRRAPGA